MYPNVCYCPVGMQSVMAYPLLLGVEYSQNEVSPAICNDKISSLRQCERMPAWQHMLC